MPTMVREQDRENERQTITLLKKVFGDSIKHTDDIHDSFDATGDRMVFEIKRRNITKNEFPTIILAERKYKALKAFDGRAFFVVVCNNGPMITEVGLHGKLQVRMGGRTDRGLVHDREPVVHIPRGEFIDL